MHFQKNTTTMNTIIKKRSSRMKWTIIVAGLMIIIHCEVWIMHCQASHKPQDIHPSLEIYSDLATAANFIDNSCRIILSTNKKMRLFEDKCTKEIKLQIQSAKRILKATSKWMHQQQQRHIYDFFSLICPPKLLLQYNYLPQT